MAITPNMDLDLPSVSVTLGPEWATLLNAALTLVDSHDHSDGKGVKVTQLGLNITDDLELNDQYLTEVGSMRLVSQAATLVTAQDLRSIYSVLGDLYYNNNSGTPIQITSGGSVTAASDGISRAFSRTSVNSNTVISAAGTTSYYDVDTTSGVTFTLPSAAGVAAGRFYEFKDTTGSAATNNIVINRAGSDTIDGATSVTINTNYQSLALVSDGTSKWGLLRQIVDTDQIKDSAVTTAKIANLNVTTGKLADGAVTQAKRASLGQQLSSEAIFSTTSASFVDVTNLTVTITTTGRPVFVGLINSASGTGSSILTRRTAGAEASSQIQILRDATAIAIYPLTLAVSGHGSLLDLNTPASAINTIDVPSAGTYTYKIQSRVVSANSVATAYVKLIAYEL
jgi:hypothetical protein